MIGNVINTIVTRVSLAGFSILLLLLNSNFLGSEGLGTVGLIVLEISVFLLFTNLVCGGSMTFFASRNNSSELLLISYFWIILIALVFRILVEIPFLRMDYMIHILSLGIIQSATATHINILVGKEKIKQYNQISFIQIALQLTALCIFYFVLEDLSVEAFIYSTYIGYSCAFILSIIQLLPLLEGRFRFPLKAVIQQIFNYGFYIQLANIAQLLNYRLSYFLLDYFSGTASVGRFIPGVQLSEGILLPGKSIAMVQFSKIANSRNRTKSAELSVKLLKLTLLLTVPFVLLLILIPSSVYGSLLSEDFTETPLVITGMSVGIVALAGEIILSRYFSGTGQQKLNATSTVIGLAVTFISGFSLIPTYGVLGAAICSSCSFTAMFVFMLYKIIQQNNFKLSELMISKADFIYWNRLLRSLKKRA